MDTSISISSDAWISEHDAIDEFGHELMHKISQRNQFQLNSIAFSRIDAQIRQMMSSFSQRTEKLQQQLIRSTQSYKLTQRESERRQRLIDNLIYRYKQMDTSVNNPESYGRNALLGHQTQGNYGTSSWNEDNSETNAARNLTADEMKQSQQMLLKEQDKGLDSLAEIIGRQKYMAQGISSEIDLQNEIIDDIGDGMDHTNQRLIRNTRNIRVVDRKSDSCCYWVVIILLFIAIMVIAFV